eukprot:COSAG05_NODE_1570_length_4527_cov_4.173216_2_plen_291_part_00
MAAEAGAGVGGSGRGGLPAPSHSDFGLHVLMNKPVCCLCSSIDGQPTAHRSTKLKQQRALAAGSDSAATTTPQASPPAGGSATTGDRQTVIDVLLANGIDPKRTSAVGWLDYESSGALLFTSDGVLNRAVKAPEAGCGKVYEVHVAGRWQASDRAVARLSEPMLFPTEGGKDTKAGVAGGVVSKPAAVRVLGQHELEGEARRLDPWPWPPHGGWATVLQVTLHEGRNRQIRRLCARSKLHVRRLHRTQIGPLSLGGLAPGKCRVLDLEQLLQLRLAAAGGFATIETVWIS